MKRIAKRINQVGLAKHMNQVGLAKRINQAGLGSAARGWGAQRGEG